MTSTITRSVARWLAAVVLGLTAAPAAHAFYFSGWPGDGVPRAHTLINPVAPRIGNPPSGQDRTIPGDNNDSDQQPPRGGGGPPPGGSDTGPGGGGPSSHPVTPEPGTAALAVLGLGAVAVARRLRRSRS